MGARSLSSVASFSLSELQSLGQQPRKGETAMNVFTLRYKQELDSEGIPRLGLFAEEVEVNPDLITGDAKAKAYTVRYDAAIAMLLNEFFKEHRTVEELNRKIQEQEVTITRLKKEMEIIVTCLKEQDSKIQKVGTQIEVSRRAPQPVVQFVAGPCRSNQ
jgi:uncharacterized coiled-coil protein SlyX